MGMMLGNNGPRAEINMTPMIDVLLVLIIIFMVITPITPKGLDSTIPQPSNAPAQPQDATLVVEVRSDRSIAINTQPVTEADLGARLTAIFAAHADRTVFVKGAPELTFNDVARVIDIARGANIHRIGLLTARMEAGQ